MKMNTADGNTLLYIIFNSINFSLHKDMPLQCVMILQFSDVTSDNAFLHIVYKHIFRLIYLHFIWHRAKAFLLLLYCHN